MEFYLCFCSEFVSVQELLKGLHFRRSRLVAESAEDLYFAKAEENALSMKERSESYEDEKSAFMKEINRIKGGRRIPWVFYPDLFSFDFDRDYCERKEILYWRKEIQDCDERQVSHRKRPFTECSNDNDHDTNIIASAAQLPITDDDSDKDILNLQIASADPLPVKDNEDIIMWQNEGIIINNTDTDDIGKINTGNKETEI